MKKKEEKLILSASFETVPGACGMGVAYTFEEFSKLPYYREPFENGYNSGGTGFICAGFREGKELDDKVFALMEKRGPCVFRTETRVNKNSGNKFYFAIFDWSNDSEYGFDDLDEPEDDDDA